MPQRTTVADVKASRLPAVLNLPPTDPRVLQFINEATQRLLCKGNWVGTVQKFRVCVTAGCLTWPRQFESILAVSVCNHPLTVRSEHFEFLENGFGLRRETDGCPSQLYDRGTAVSFEDIRGSDKKLKVYCDLAADNATPILFQGYDDNGQWISTIVSGQYVDGEYIIPGTTGTLSTRFFSSLTGVQKPVTQGPVRVYEYDTNLTTQRSLAYYEADETNPCYRRSLIAGLSNVNGCNGTGDCETKTVTVLAKMAYLPVRKDTDWLLIGNIPALKCECQALRKFENNLFQEAEAYEAEAIKQLQQELNAYIGDATVCAIRMPDRSIYGAGVANIH